MGITPFSPEAQQLAALEIRLNAGDLTLSEIQDIEDQIVLTAEKTKQSAGPLFDRLEQKKQSLADRQLALTQEIFALSEQIAILGATWNQLPPDEIEAKLDTLKTKAAKMESPASPWVQKVQVEAQKQLEHMEFVSFAPIATELDLSIDPTFASRMGQIANRMREQNSLLPFQSLNSMQQKEIVRFAKEGA